MLIKLKNSRLAFNPEHIVTIEGTASGTEDFWYTIYFINGKQICISAEEFESIIEQKPPISTYAVDL